MSVRSDELLLELILRRAGGDPTYQGQKTWQAGEGLVVKGLGSGGEFSVVPAEAYADAFGRQRISEPKTLFSSKLTEDAAPVDYDDQEVSGSGTSSTWNQNKAEVVMAVSDTTAGKRVRRTFQRFDYQPGKGQAITLTGRMGAPTAGITREIAYASDENGLGFRVDGDGISVFKRTYINGLVQEEVKPQTSWNDNAMLDDADPLDGSGDSGITLDPSKVEIFIVDFEWLGVGSVRFGFVIDGKAYYVHRMVHANRSDSVYMSTPNLPITYSIENDGTGPAADMAHICSTVVSEGGAEAVGKTGYISTASGTISANSAGTIYPVVGYRLKAANLGAKVEVASVSLLCSSNDDFEWLLILNPTVTGTFAYSDVTNYPIQRAVGSTATATGGTVLGGGFGNRQVPVSDTPYNQRYVGASIAGVPDEMVLAVRSLATNTVMRGGLTFRAW